MFFKILCGAALFVGSSPFAQALPGDIAAILDPESRLQDFRRPPEAGSANLYTLLEVTVEGFTEQDNGQLLLDVFSAEWIGNRYIREFRGLVQVDPRDGYEWEEMLSSLPATILVLSRYQNHEPDASGVPLFSGHWFRRLRP